MSEETKINLHPYRLLHHNVYTVAVYGQGEPIICRGFMVLRSFYKDEKKTVVDVDYTSQYYIDELFYETDKTIHESRKELYGGKRDLVEVEMPEIGSEYRLIYNRAQTNFNYYEETISILKYKNITATGTALILRRDPAKGIQYLSEEEAKEVQRMLSVLLRR